MTLRVTVLKLVLLVVFSVYDVSAQKVEILKRSGGGIVNGSHIAATDEYVFVGKGIGATTVIFHREEDQWKVHQELTSLTTSDCNTESEVLLWHDSDPASLIGVPYFVPHHLEDGLWVPYDSLRLAPPAQIPERFLRLPCAMTDEILVLTSEKAEFNSIAPHYMHFYEKNNAKWEETYSFMLSEEKAVVKGAAVFGDEAMVCTETRDLQNTEGDSFTKTTLYTFRKATQGAWSQVKAFSSNESPYLWCDGDIRFEENFVVVRGGITRDEAGTPINSENTRLFVKPGVTFFDRMGDQLVIDVEMYYGNWPYNDIDPAAFPVPAEYNNLYVGNQDGIQNRNNYIVGLDAHEGRVLVATEESGGAIYEKIGGRWLPAIILETENVFGRANQEIPVSLSREVALLGVQRLLGGGFNNEVNHVFILDDLPDGSVQVSGKLLDVQLNPNGQRVELPLAGANAQLFEEDVFIQNVDTDEAGSFLFPGVDPEKRYVLSVFAEAQPEESGETYSVLANFENVLIAADQELIVPVTILEQKYDLINRLENLSLTPELLVGLEAEIFLDTDYNEIAARAVLEDWRSDMNKNQEDILESLSRLILAEEVVSEVFDDAAILSHETGVSLVEYVFVIYGASFLQRELEKSRKISASGFRRFIWSNLLFTAKKFVVEEAISYGKNLIIENVDPPFNTSLGIAFDTVLREVLYRERVQNITKDLFVNAVAAEVDQLLLPEYVYSTQPFLDQSAGKAAAHFYLSTTVDASSETRG